MGESMAPTSKFMLYNKSYVVRCMIYNKKVTLRGSVRKRDKTKAHTVFSRPCFLTIE